MTRRAQIIKLGRLLDMLYKPSELAEELDISVDTVYRSYVPGGAPVVRKDGIIFIPGREFITWFNELAKQNRETGRFRLEDGEAWCLRCNKAVAMLDPRTRRVSRSVMMTAGRCPDCGCRVNRVGGGK